MSLISQQAIPHVLQQDSQILQTLLEKLKQLQQLDALLAEHLDPRLASHCQVATLENNCLIVITDNAIWATQFRFQAPTLLPKLRQHPQLYALKNISCKIRPKHNVDLPKPERPVARLSLETAAIITETAQSIPHQGLQAIMLKIASHSR
jgi:hypothetical protein